ncbi:MAG: phosphotyrosine protein phosphatase [Lachnospiraceae bacterium]|nr:phosphotyrosine protein phosphatase [Lachnospiraceae bacterium]
MKQYKKVIFVCDSGTSRAPMAEAIMKEYTVKYPLQIESRGLVVLFPEPLNQKAEAVLISNGINMPEMMSSQLEGEDLSPDNLILTFEAAQKEKILQDFEEAVQADVEVLTELVGDELEILNPYGGALQAYGLCYETMNKTVQKLVSLLNEAE